MVEPRGLEVAADWRTLQSPETYVGYAQSSGFAQEEGAVMGGVGLEKWVQQGHRLRRPPHRRQHAGAVELGGGVHGQRGMRTRGKKRCT